MYNGIGLTTARGSGTSGHVVKNVSYLKPEFFRNKVDSNAGRLNDNGQSKGLVSGLSNMEILDHNKKREIESKLYELQETMIDQGYSDAEIQVKLAAARKVNSSRGTAIVQKSSRLLNDSHLRESVKKEENQRIRSAFGIKSGFVEGDSFNEERIALQKTERIAEREDRDKKRKERELQKPREERDRVDEGRGSSSSSSNSRRDRSRDRDRDRSDRRRSRSRSRSNDRSSSRRSSR